MAAYMEEMKKKYYEKIAIEAQGFEPEGKVSIFLYETYSRYCRDASSISLEAKEEAYKRRSSYLNQHRINQDVKWCFELLP
jgi:hypothetical protein